MKKIILNRPKTIEKYYDETKYKVFINDKLVTRLKRGEPVELEVEDDAIDIQARIAWRGSKKERIELSEEITEIDIARNQKYPYRNGNSAYILIAVFVFTIIQTITPKNTLMVLYLLVVVAFIFYVVKYEILNRHQHILIMKRPSTF